MASTRGSSCRPFNMCPGAGGWCCVKVLFAGRKRITREPLLPGAQEIELKMGSHRGSKWWSAWGIRCLSNPFKQICHYVSEEVAIHSRDLPTLQLISALDAFSDLVLPYHLLFESVVVELQRKQPLSWQQVIAVLEAFSVRDPVSFFMSRAA